MATDNSAAGTKEKERAFFEALGRLATDYAMAEAGVHELARRISGMPDEKARLIFGGMRLIDVIKRTRAILHLDRHVPDKIKEFDDCMVRLDLIGQNRDKLVHRAVSYESDKLRVSNEYTARKEDDAEIQIGRAHV